MDSDEDSDDDVVDDVFGNINDNSIGFGVGKDGKGYDEKYKYFNRNQLKYPKKPNSFLVKEK